MSRTVFFSWQSDRSTKEGRNLIEKALENAVAKIAADITVEEVVRDGLKLDKDTKGVPGSPPIFETILNKIDRAAVFVADLTFCGSRCTGKPTPNPNVLIEYGWALKALGHHQVIAIMNEAHGAPAPESMPFDLAHVRFPITYHLPDDALDAKRREVRAQLSTTLETALRDVFESEHFKGKLGAPASLPFFQGKDAKEGQARFRQSSEPLGVYDDLIAKLIGQPQALPLYLSKGAAIWLRLMPLYEVKRKWLTQDLKGPVINLATLPLMNKLETSSGSIGVIRGEDGCGSYQIWNDQSTAHSIAYVFNTGEIWMVNSWLAETNKIIPFQESTFTRTLDQCAKFLDGLGSKKPYKWIVGMEGIQGHNLVLPPHYNKPKGPCLANVIEEEGVYRDNDTASQLLQPFFEKVFDYCGERRSNYTSHAR